MSALSAYRTTRPVFTGTKHVASTCHYLATMAGNSILEAGGNAVDAGCAAGIALGVVQSDIVNVAGVAPIILRMADRPEVITIAGLGWWPKALDPQVFLRDHGGTLPPGVLRTVVPSAPDAWITALERFGTMRFADVAAPAIALARDGFHMHELMAKTIAEKEADYARWESTKAVYLPHGRPPAVGELFRQTDLAAALQYMADEDRARPDRTSGYEAARRAFYVGDIAERIIAVQEQHGGFLRREDLAQYRSEVGLAVSRRFRDHEVFVCDAWCQGPILLQALRLAERAGLAGLKHNGPDYVHRLTEILKVCFADREQFFGDPRFVDVPIERLLSEAYADSCWDGIDPARAAEARKAPAAPDPTTEPDTSYVCVIDRWGNTFSATPSDGSWHSPVVPGTGLVPSGRGTQSRLDPSHPAGLAPGKRPRLTPSPALVRWDDGTTMAFGTPGGDVQIQAMLQVFLNYSLFGANLQQAIEAPRFATYSFPSSFYPYEDRPNLLKLEDGIACSTADDLEKRGHRIEWWPKLNWLAGGVCAALRSRDRLVMGGADPRRPSIAIGW